MMSNLRRGIGWILKIISVAIMGCSFLAVLSSIRAGESTLQEGIVAGVLIAIGYGIFRFAEKVGGQNAGSRRTSTHPLDLSFDAYERKQQEIYDNTFFDFKLKLIYGLDIPSPVTVDFHYSKPEVIIDNSGICYCLAKQKIVSIELKDEIEMESGLVSSVGGAVLGGAMFGVLGAAIGGRAKNKSVKLKKYFLIITYIKEEKPEYILFEISREQFFSSKLNKMIKHFNIERPETAFVEV